MFKRGFYLSSHEMKIINSEFFISPSYEVLGSDDDMPETSIHTYTQSAFSPITGLTDIRSKKYQI